MNNSEPFRIEIPQAVIDDLAARLSTARMPPHGAAEGSIEGWEAGASPAYMRELLDYWRDQFDWRKQEAQLNRLRHFRTSVEGAEMHYVFERGRGPMPMPLLLTHGWPDSFARFAGIIPMLADPGAHGGDPADAFDVVAPSLPGFGFSEPLKRGDLFHFDHVLNKLMTEKLGYHRYGAHGGDFGSTITEHLARSHGQHVIGIHLTDVPFWHTFQKPKDITPEEQDYIDKTNEAQKQHGAYALIQGTRPQTLADGLNDSPIGLAAWIVEKFLSWSDCEGRMERCLSKDELLTHVMLYWATGTVGSSFGPYYDIMHAGPQRWMLEMAKGAVGRHNTPAGFAMFPKDLSHPPKQWAERFFNVERWTKMPHGGHFAAMEQPELLVEDIRAFFRPLRRLH